MFEPGDIVVDKFDGTRYKVLRIVDGGAFLRPLIKKSEIEEWKYNIEKAFSKCVLYPQFFEVNIDIKFKPIIFVYPFDDEDYELVKKDKLSKSDERLIRKVINSSKKQRSKRKR